MSGVLRQLLLRLADQGIFYPIWTERIGQEWRRNAARIWNKLPEVLAEQWEDMNRRFPQANETDIAAYELSLRYSDPKDFHVIAAGLARRARCRLPRPPAVYVLTWNLKDFSRPELRRQGLDVYTPDRLLAQWWMSHKAPIWSALCNIPTDLQDLGRPVEPLALTLHRERLYRLKNLVAAAALA
jgi:hypothetical protein